MPLVRTNAIKADSRLLINELSNIVEKMRNKISNGVKVAHEAFFCRHMAVLCMCGVCFYFISSSMCWLRQTEWAVELIFIVCSRDVMTDNTVRLS